MASTKCTIIIASTEKDDNKNMYPVGCRGKITGAQIEKSYIKHSIAAINPSYLFCFASWDGGLGQNIDRSPDRTKGSKKPPLPQHPSARLPCESDRGEMSCPCFSHGLSGLSGFTSCFIRGRESDGFFGHMVGTAWCCQ